MQYNRRCFSVQGKRLKRATFWMDVDSLSWIRSYAKQCRISQGALINAVLADFMASKCVPSSDPRRVEDLRNYSRILLARAPNLRY